MNIKTIRMPKATWEKWDAALRSGEYKQGAEQLHNPVTNGYCCLGVLQHCLVGTTESDMLREQADHGEKAADEMIQEGLDELPSKEWLDEYKIAFDGIGEGAFRGVQPYLPKFGNTAAVVNDETDFPTEYDGSKAHKNDFIKIADAIADAVEFTDA